jgi:formylmethanofuran dehydrogenase subunit E
MSPEAWSRVMKECGIEVDYDDDGDFCSYCGEWVKETKTNDLDDEVCLACYERNKDED